MTKAISAFCFVLLLSGIGAASEPGADSRFLHVPEVRAGMKGHGLTVFQGSTPERFEVEVLGILDGIPHPKQSLIIARLGGPLVERTSVFAGMSGSPVYIDGRLVGAIAYAFPFAKEPIAGITPIKYMIEVFERVPDQQPRSEQRPSFNTLISAAEKGMGGSMERISAQIGPRAAASGMLGEYVGQTLVRIATPVNFTGIPQAVLDLFAGDLVKMGIHPIAGVGGGSSLTPLVPFSETTLTPGTSVSAQLVRGDFTIDAAGTVTHRDGERVYAFGHPFLSSGQTAWPMAESSVVTVVPNLNNSFKLSASGKLVGSISQDRSTGIFGQLGVEPQMIPVNLKVRTSRNKVEDYSFEIVADSFLTPLLMKITMFTAIAATERQIGNQTINVAGRIVVNGQSDVILDNSFSAVSGAAIFAVTAVERPLSILLNSGFDKVDLNRIELEVTSVDQRSTGSLTRLWVDKTEARRGEVVDIQAFARNDNGMQFVEHIALEIPADAPVGPLAIVVGDGASMNQTEMRLQPVTDFTPRDLGQLVRAINKLKKNNRLYIKVLRSGSGAIVNNEEMPSLPPSVLATLGSQRTSGGYTPLNVAILAERALPPSKFIITGQQTITINVVK